MSTEEPKGWWKSLAEHLKLIGALIGVPVGIIKILEYFGYPWPELKTFLEAHTVLTQRLGFVALFLIATSMEWFRRLIWWLLPFIVPKPRVPREPQSLPTPEERRPMEGLRFFGSRNVPVQISSYSQPGATVSPDSEASRFRALLIGFAYDPPEDIPHTTLTLQAKVEYVYGDNQKLRNPAALWVNATCNQVWIRAGDMHEIVFLWNDAHDQDRTPIAYEDRRDGRNDLGQNDWNTKHRLDRVSGGTIRLVNSSANRSRSFSVDVVKLNERDYDVKVRPL